MCANDIPTGPQTGNPRLSLVEHPTAAWLRARLEQYCDLIIAGAGERSIPLRELVRSLQDRLSDRSQPC
jgi:hypothetical protein